MKRYWPFMVVGIWVLVGVGSPLLTLKDQLQALDSEIRVESIPPVGVSWPIVDLYTIEHTIELEDVRNITISNNQFTGSPCP